MVNGRERSTPVSDSPPGGRLHKNQDALSPSADTRFWINHGLAGLAMPSTGVLNQVSERSSADANKRSASPAPQSRTPPLNAAPRCSVPCWIDLNNAN